MHKFLETAELFHKILLICVQILDQKYGSSTLLLWVKDKLPLFRKVVVFPIGVEMRSNCESFMSDAMFTPRPSVHR
jgi:hypothetical protein